jgi:hypothetical protein
MMLRKSGYIILFVFIHAAHVHAQAIDNTISLRDMQSNHYFRFFYENDFFSGTDRDYTQGVQIELAAPWLRKNPLSKILFKPKNSAITYGIAAEMDAYTPNHLDDAQIIYGDRPYAATLMLKTFIVAKSDVRHELITDQLSIGVIGPAAGGEAVQKAIHKAINYITPLGWHNQIRNDAVLNYQVNDERELISLSHWLSFSGFASIRAGTLSTKATGGFTAMIGNFNSPFRNYSSPKKFQWYVYEQPLGNVVAYDATLQGGLFDRSSPYTVPDRNIERFTFQHKFGLVIIIDKTYLEYFQTGITREFATSVYHRTGGLQFSINF